VVAEPSFACRLAYEVNRFSLAVNSADLLGVSPGLVICIALLTEVEAKSVCQSLIPRAK
jgi:hypothetical protein